MAQQTETRPRQSFDASWLAGLIEAFETVSRPELHPIPCDPALIEAIAEHLARPLPVATIRRHSDANHGDANQPVCDRARAATRGTGPCGAEWAQA